MNIAPQHIGNYQKPGRKIDINLGEITNDRLDELQALCHAKQSAAESFSAAVKAVADKARIEPQALSAYITFLCKDTDKQEKVRRAHQQLELLFDELGDR